MESKMQHESGIYVLSGTYGGDTVVKVGRTTSGVFQRVEQLNKLVYAGVDDWYCVGWYEQRNARLVNAYEKMAHDELARYKISLPNGNGGMAHEVFEIDWQEAVERIDGVLESAGASVCYRSQDCENEVVGDNRRAVSSLSAPFGDESAGVEAARKIKLIFAMIVLGLALIGLANINV